MNNEALARDDAAAKGIALVFAPVHGDTHALRDVLRELGLRIVTCANPQEFFDGLGDETLLAVVTEEGLVQCNTDALANVLLRQPPWSDIPLLALVGNHSIQVDDGRFSRVAELGNFTLLQRPAARQALLMSIRSALRTRRLQYATRDQLCELELHAAGLETAVQARTQELQREVKERIRVEAALEDARRLESLGRLTGGVAHDFNNVLQVIAGAETLIRFAQGKDIEPRMQRALDGIHRAAERGASLTQRLLAYARRQPLANVTLDLAAHLTATADLLLKSAGDDVDLQLRLPSSLWQVEVDPSQLDAAILNVVGNARDAMGGRGRLLIFARNLTLPDDAIPEARHLQGDYVGLLFSDDGAGMSEEVARQAFEPFYTTKGVGMGTGLGLSQVYGFAVQSGGLAFIRRERIGTTIGVLLPKSAAMPAVAAVAPRLDRESGLQGLRLLCVDDDLDVIETTAALLRGLGAHVVLADSADAAVKMDLAPFDLVVSDVMMAGALDGIGLARWLAVRYPGLPVVLCSGYMLDPQRLNSVEVEFLRKPYTLAELVGAIRRAQERCQPARLVGTRD